MGCEPVGMGNRIQESCVMTEANPNRAQRRAAKHQAKHKPARRLVLNAHMVATEWSRPYDPDEMIKEHNLTSAAFIRLRDGGGSELDFNRVSMRLNIVRIRAESIDSGLADTICAGQLAMQRMKERHLRGLALGFDADGLQTVPAALEVHQIITDASSPMQMEDAAGTVLRAFQLGVMLDKVGFLCPI